MHNILLVPPRETQSSAHKAVSLAILLLLCIVASACSNDSAQSAPTTAQDYYKQGQADAASGNKDQALADYSQAIKLDPKYADAYLARALIYQEKQDYSDDIADSTEAITLKPSYDAYVARGIAYVRIGDTDPTKRQPDLALQDFNAAAQLNPDAAVVYSYKALAYYFKNDYDDAIANNTEAIRRDQSNADAYFARGESYQAKQEYDLAISDFDEYINLRPNTSWAFRQRGDVYQAKGDYPHAVLDYTEAIRLQPDYGDAY